MTHKANQHSCLVTYRPRNPQLYWSARFRDPTAQGTSAPRPLPYPGDLHLFQMISFANTSSVYTVISHLLKTVLCNYTFNRTRLLLIMLHYVVLKDHTNRRPTCEMVCRSHDIDFCYDPNAKFIGAGQVRGAAQAKALWVLARKESSSRLQAVGVSGRGSVSRIYESGPVWGSEWQPQPGRSPRPHPNAFCSTPRSLIMGNIDFCYLHSAPGIEMVDVL